MLTISLLQTHGPTLLRCFSRSHRRSLQSVCRDQLSPAIVVATPFTGQTASDATSVWIVDIHQIYSASVVVTPIAGWTAYDVTSEWNVDVHQLYSANAVVVASFTSTTC